MFCLHRTPVHVAMQCAANVRKLNDLIKRARLARVLALVVEELHGAMPLLRRDTAKRNLLAKLDSTVRAVEASDEGC